ncbi:substrate-binding periplasmic protein [Pseudoalteromonas phenolica]|uniref:ABC-type amino acid transport/signal transduction system, periplasmic component/domain protein n=2 Tax=Pseudoalteromonas phenolica TaxID=161398 RepID=A0A0S2K7W9_9GAMM|nr:transporter substrate-binding domain-containing protein [Pseudoalteromonas phenolica]ALO44066.1 ABC-type amino acid transport/signal transduction system, periplasmic component/domain protein [Pseudoalteromonas phenolica]MBE0357047.1 polar amino acid transport system substrate-binding protein [Pseudoalteromonas phenolica O-BC30]RXF06476.1 hypothetical protein D9981_01120 [Pseudoalteromonas phenolica O-BC30]TMO57968.1 hypothetical protein CWC21_01570 [Pseudoalteromonas phenolica]
MLCGSGHTKQLTIAIGDYPPFASKALPKQGIVPRVIRAAFASEGYTVKFEFMPWGRSFASALKGKYDAAAFWFCVPERKKNFHCSEPLYYEATYFYFRKSKPLTDWGNLSELSEFNIGATKGYSYTEEFWEFAKRGVLNVNTVTSDVQNFKKLLKGRIDLFPIATIPAKHILKEHFAAEEVEQVAFHAKPLMVESSHLLFLKQSKKSEVLLKAFNRGLSAIKESGEYQTILNSLGTFKTSSAKYIFVK